MNYFKLLTSGMERNRVKTAFTVSSIVVAFLLLGLLRPISDVFESGSQSESERLVVTPKHSITDMLRVSQIQPVRKLAGVEAATHITWFGGHYRDGSTTFPQYAVSNPSFRAVFSDLVMPDTQWDGFAKNRSGAIIGRKLAEEFNLHVGDPLPLIPTIWHNRDGHHWAFNIVGIFDGEAADTDTRTMYFNYAYFDEYRAFGNGSVSNIVVELAPGISSASVSSLIDDLFSNSSNETLTLSESEYALTFLRQLGDIGLAVTGVLLAVFFTILLLTANTLLHSLNERIPEYAILKTLGFKRVTIVMLVIGEAVAIVFLGAVIGLALAAAGLTFSEQLVPIMHDLGSPMFEGRTLVTGLLAALATSLVVGLTPAIKAARINIVDALKGN